MNIKLSKLNPKGFSAVELLILIVVVGIIGGIGAYVVSKSNAQSPKSTTTTSNTTTPTTISGYTADVTFTATDGTWPTAVLSDPMSVALGRYNSDYGYTGEKTYGPVISLTGTASGLKTNLNADTTVNCGQTEPVPHFVYDSASGQWGQSGDTQMSLQVYRLVNGSNTVGLNIFGAQTSKIDKTKPMICYAQIYVTQKQGTKLTTAVPVTQKFTLQPK